jgi:phosphatidate cytidylyltransferase
MKRLFFASTFIFSLFSFGFFIFSGIGMELMLFVFMIVSIFDSFSQISGQTFGRKKILPKISPDKTVEGFIGGAIVAILSAILLRDLIGESAIHAMIRASGVVIFAFIGDISKSYYKRKYKVKDFSNLIPGNGGFLDRFDSLMAAGAWIALTG